MKHMKRMIVALGFVLVFTYPTTNTAHAADGEWDQYRDNPANNPVIEYDQLDEDLSIEIETKNEIRSTPVVIEDKLFVGNHETGELSAFNIETGELLWENQAPNWVHSEMIYVNDQIFVGYGNRSMKEDGVRGTGESGMLSLDPETGETLWDFETFGEVMPTPAFYDGIVYIVTGDKHVYGVQPETGEEEWSLDLGSRSNMSSPNIKDGILYVGGSAPFVFSAVDLDERELLWQEKIDEVNTGLGDVPPVISEDDIVYTTGVSNLEYDASIYDIYNEMGLVRGIKYVFTRSMENLASDDPRGMETIYEHYLYAMDGTNGDLVWRASLGKGRMKPHNRSGAPMLYDDHVYVGSPVTQKFYRFDAETGEETWKYQAFINKAPPVAKDDVVYFTDMTGLVYGFDVKSGDLLGKKQLGGKLYPSGPVILNDHLLIGSQDTNVYIVPTDEILDSDDKPDYDVE